MTTQEKNLVPTTSNSTDSVPIEKMLRDLKSRYVGERQAAEETLNKMGLEAVEQLVALIQRDHNRRKMRRRIYFGLVALFCTTFLPAALYCLYMCITLSMAGNNAAGGAYGGAIGGLLGGGGGGILGGFAWLLVPTQRQLLAAEAIAKIKDKQAVGALALCLNMPDMAQNLRFGAAQALMNILPQLTADDGKLLNQDQREALYRVFKDRKARDRDTQFLVEIVNALERIGDLRAIEPIKALIEAPVKTRNEQFLFDAAKPAYDRLLVKRELANTSALLVRAATDPQAPSETLVRPAYGTGDNNPAVLLRPTVEE